MAKGNKNLKNPTGTELEKDKRAKLIPEGIVDKIAYAKAVKLQSHWIIKNPFYVCSDGVEINIAMLPHVLRKRIAHLNKSEREEILDLKDLYFKINNNLTVQKRKAYGFKHGVGSSVMFDQSAQKNTLVIKKEEIIEYFGRMFTPSQIKRLLEKDMGVSVGYKDLKGFQKRFANEIDEKIQEHKRSYSNIRLGIKKSRLEELSDIYEVHKINWEDTEKKDDAKLLLTILEQIRKESEGDRLTIDGKIDVKHEHDINLLIMRETFQTINIKEIILARVAARMGVNPIKLIYSLQNSYYKQFSNVLGDFNEEDANKELPYPSQLGYNFETIGKIYNLRDKEVEDAVIVEDEEFQRTRDKEKSERLKEMLKLKLRERNKGHDDFRKRMRVNDIEESDDGI